MTEEELKKVPFRMQCHLRMENEHTMMYISGDGRLGFTDHIPYKDGVQKGRTRRHWRIDNKVYKSKKKFLEAIRDFCPTAKIVLTI